MEDNCYQSAAIGLRARSIVLSAVLLCKSEAESSSSPNDYKTVTAHIPILNYDQTSVYFGDNQCTAPNVCYYLLFSNSLIIHQVKTKEITTVKEVWIPGLN